MRVPSCCHRSRMLERRLDGIQLTYGCCGRWAGSSARRSLGNTPPRHRRSGPRLHPVSASKSLVDGGGKRLGDVCAAPGEPRPRIDAEASEYAGERLGLKEGTRHLFVTAGAGRRMGVNDRSGRGALGLELSENGGSGPPCPGGLHTAGCIAVARRRPVRAAMDILAAPLAEKDLELPHALMVADASPEPVTEHPSSCNRLCGSESPISGSRAEGGRQGLQHPPPVISPPTPPPDWVVSTPPYAAPPTTGSRRRAACKHESSPTTDGGCHTAGRTAEGCGVGEPA